MARLFESDFIQKRVILMGMDEQPIGGSVVGSIREVHADAVLPDLDEIIQYRWAKACEFVCSDIDIIARKSDGCDIWGLIATNEGCGNAILPDLRGKFAIDVSFYSRSIDIIS